jgi:5-methylcytosine-specific restriction enzyme subunit McrC
MATRRLTLTEHDTTVGCALSVAEREGLRGLYPRLRIEPTAGRGDRYDLTPDERIGIVSLPGLVVEIRPKIPLRSVLFLVSYACGLAKWSDAQAEFAPDAEPVEFLALMLARLVEQATRRGLLNGYRSEEEALSAPRGRILFDEQLRRRAGIAPPIEVRHDLFTPDVLENRLLLAALETMRRFPHRAPATRRELARAEQLLGGVRRVWFPPSAVPDVRFTQLNAHYQPAVTLATLVLRSASLELGTGGARGTAFLIDMNKVFEVFVRKALREALGASERDFPDRPPHLRLDERGRVPLKPDLYLLDGDRITWVGDAKYKRLGPASYHNADLYQVLAYATVLGLSGATLIYAAGQGVDRATHVVRRSGIELQVVALDLSTPGVTLTQIERIAVTIQRGSAHEPLQARA